MQKIDFDGEYFNPKDVLECGQVFRFERFKDGYKVFSRDKACYVYTDGKKTVIESEYPEYFYKYFDFDNDYKVIIKEIKKFNVPALDHELEAGK